MLLADIRSWATTAAERALTEQQPAVQQGDPAPAGGAALDQVLVAGGFTLLVHVALVWVMWRERRPGTSGPVARVAERTGALDGGSPRWFVAPMGWLWAVGYGATFALFALVFALIAAAYAQASRPRRSARPTATATDRVPLGVGA